jgi:hypothetical protein
MYIRTHRYRRLTEEMRPQDERMDASTLTFETMEHGGEYPDLMPQAIKVTDAQGRWCVYEPMTVSGEVVQSLGFEAREEEG